MKFNPFKNLGPGTLVAAAFIGPGTVTTCTKAGASFGFALIWALLLSIVATVVLQEMSSRLGLVSGQGLAEAVKNQLKTKWIKFTVLALIIAAILIGNSAYQAGNISGGVLGLSSIFPNTIIQIGSVKFSYLLLILGVIAGIVLYIGNYKVLEKLLVFLVLLMSFSFLLTAILTKPNLGDLFSETFIPSIPEGGAFTIMGLIGTTVVPYNLFLHASVVREKWNGNADAIPEQLKKSRRDTFYSILLGGLVSISIIISAAAIHPSEIKNVTDLSKGLEPLYGNAARYFLGIGLCAAGVTSAITAPMAAAYVARECFGWSKDLKSVGFRLTWGIVLVSGILFSILGSSPIELIQFAQVANGILMPVIAIFLIWIVNRSGIMKDYVNKTYQNILGGLIIAITIGLTVKTMITLFS